MKRRNQPIIDGTVSTMREVDSLPDAKTPRLAHHRYAEILGVRVSAINMDSAIKMAEAHLSTHQTGYVCVTGVHGVMEAQDDPSFRDILNRAAMNTPDGMPMSWVGWLQGHRSMDRVYGPDLMLAMCEFSVKRGYRHFLYGGKDGVAELLAKNLRQRFPGLQVVGTFTPPFRPLDAQEEEHLIERVKGCKPDVFWVGLSTPKQEKFMSAYMDRLGVPLMVGVGAAFDIHTGNAKDAPAWMKRAGLQWLHRLLQEPKRLSTRYLKNNPKFVFQITRQFLLRS